MRTFFVPSTIGQWRVADLAAPPHLQEVFGELGIDSLRDLEQFSFGEVARFSERGEAIIPEIRSFIREMQAVERADRRASAGAEGAAFPGRSLRRPPVPPGTSQPSAQPPGGDPAGPACPELISLPEAVWHYRLGALPISARLLNVLRHSGRQRLGDLHGVRVADLLLVRNCGLKTVEELRALVSAARRGELRAPPLGSAPPPARVGVFVVPPAAYHLSPFDLPLSGGLEGVLQSIDIQELGELDGVPHRDLLRLRGFAKVRLQELVGLLDRLARGEFDRLGGRFSTRRIGELLRVVEELLEELTPRQRTIMLRRFGAEDNRVWTLKELAVLCGITRERVRQITRCCLRSIHKAGGPGLKAQLAGLHAACRRSEKPFTPHLLVQWLPRETTPPRLPPEFHVRLLTALNPDLAAWVEPPRAVAGKDCGTTRPSRS
ncbi:MAG: hypothetical protein HYY24_06240 [Verrucomicrobia bacterium]|nr:hypothetical protein [Verrucomicrobiota bacterium]